MTSTSATVRTPALSRRVQLAAASCLGLGSLLIAVPQYIEKQWSGDLERLPQIRWGLAHLSFVRIEWMGAMIGGFLLLLGSFGLWQLTRSISPRLTAVGAVVLTWGLSGQIFSDTATFTGQVVAAHVLGADQADKVIDKGYLHDPAMIAGVLVPVILGMLIGLGLLVVALWRAGLPRGAVIALAIWPLWDFFGPGTVGPLSGELGLAVGGVWLAVALARAPRERWIGSEV